MVADTVGRSSWADAATGAVEPRDAVGLGMTSVRATRDMASVACNPAMREEEYSHLDLRPCHARPQSRPNQSSERHGMARLGMALTMTWTPGPNTNIGYLQMQMIKLHRVQLRFRDLCRNGSA